MENGWMIAEIILINLVLSGDNALLIAMAGKNLPAAQQKQAVWWGTLGAIIMRIALAAVAVYLMEIPMIRMLGALLLSYIAVKLLVDHHHESEMRPSGDSLAKVVRTIIMADLIMSLDNVLAVVAVAKGDLILIALGIGISIPLIIGGSALILRLLSRLPLLIYAGSAILGYTAGEMLVSEPFIGRLLSHAHPSFHHTIPLALATAVTLFGRMGSRTLKA